MTPFTFIIHSQHSEAPFVLNDYGYTLRGRIDKLFKDRTSHEWAIIDWKTWEVRDADPVIFARENYFDLWAVSCRQLMEAGLKEKNIEVAEICTHCRTDLFYSYRAEGKTGRFATVAMLC